MSQRKMICIFHPINEPKSGRINVADMKTKYNGSQMILWLFLLLILIPPGQSYAEADGPDYYRIKSDEPVNVHEKDNNDSKILGTIPAGARGLKNLGSSGVTPFDEWIKMSPEEQSEAKEKIWRRISYKGLEGWVQNKYLAEDSAPSSPSFDCAKAEGEVEHIICSDPELMNLDNQMAVVYKEATQKAVNEHPPFLKAEQRGWIKGRNDCWKSDDKKKCVEQEYKLRIAELQARYRLVSSNGPIYYSCDDNPAKEVVITYFKTDPPTLIAEFGDSVSLMYLQPSGSGSKYQGRNESAWIKGKEAMITWGYGSAEMNCKQKS